MAAHLREPGVCGDVWLRESGRNAVRSAPDVKFSGMPIRTTVNEVLRILNEHGAMAPRSFSVVHRDGSRFVVLVAGAGKSEDAAGALLFKQAEHIDITDRKQAE